MISLRMRRRRKMSRSRRALKTTRACFKRQRCSRAPRVQGARYAAFDATAAVALLHQCCVPAALLIHCLLLLLYLLLLLQIVRGQNQVRLISRTNCQSTSHVPMLSNNFGVNVQQSASAAESAATSVGSSTEDELAEDLEPSVSVNLWRVAEVYD